MLYPMAGSTPAQRRAAAGLRRCSPRAPPPSVIVVMPWVWPAERILVGAHIWARPGRARARVAFDVGAGSAGRFARIDGGAVLRQVVVPQAGIHEARRFIQISTVPMHRPMTIRDDPGRCALNIRILNRHRLARPIGIEVDLLGRIAPDN